MAAFGLAGTIAQFVGIAKKTLKRLEEFHKSAGNMSESFQDISNILQLLITCLTSTEKQDKAGKANAERQAALKPVIHGCRRQIEKLDGLLEKYLPKSGDAKWKRGWWALMSVRQEDDIKDLRKAIKEYVPLLHYYELIRTQ